HDAYHIVYRTGAERATIVWRADDHSDCRNAHLQGRERRYWCGLHHAGSDARLGAARARSRHGDRTWYRQIHERVPGAYQHHWQWHCRHSGRLVGGRARPKKTRSRAESAGRSEQSQHRGDDRVKPFVLPLAVWVGIRQLLFARTLLFQHTETENGDTVKR